MSGVGVDTRSLRAERLRAAAPRLLLYATLTVLCLAGLRAIVAGAPEPVTRPAPAPERTQRPDALPVASFAEGFARAYLTWNAADPDARERALAPFVAATSDTEAGLTPGEGTSQFVEWVAAVATASKGGRTLVTVAAWTGERLVHLAVPVAVTGRGRMYVAGYPALVGPPAIDRAAALAAPEEEAVEDRELTTVVGRALANYLAREQQNLLADLTRAAVVSLPARSLRLLDVGDPTWVVADRRVAVEVEAADDSGTAWTLRYELDVEWVDRWYVRSIHVDPTTRGEP